MTEDDIRKIVENTVDQTLMKLGIDPAQPLEYQKDMAMVRTWRTSSETIKRQSLMTAIGIFTTGLLGLIWMALKGH